MRATTVAALAASFVLSAGLGLTVGAVAGVGPAPVVGNSLADPEQAPDDVTEGTGTESPETESPETESPETDSPETGEPEDDSAEESASDATAYGQVLRAWKECVRAATADCGTRPRPKGHAHGWDRNGFADGTKVTGRPATAGKKAHPSRYADRGAR